MEGKKKKGRDTEKTEPFVYLPQILMAWIQIESNYFSLLLKKFP